MWVISASFALVIWSIILLLPWHPWRTREALDTIGSRSHPALDDISVVIPARDEAAVIAATLESLQSQDRGLRIIVVDDNSSDGTADIVRKFPLGNMKLVLGTPLPPGWTGKLWAQEQGIRSVQTPLTLLLDADIVLSPGTVNALAMKKQESGAHFVSLMAAPHLETFWERLLMPAFVYFFKMIYPFSLSNSRHSRVAAAAGGCILMETRIFEQIGGIAVLKGAVIDDCALAKLVKSAGNVTWTGLTHSARSQRPYQKFSDIWNMVARTAYTQLFYSIGLLVLCTVLMLILFVGPMIGMVFTHGVVQLMSVCAFTAMLASYLPCLKYYGCKLVWVVTLPFAAGLYLAMTWSSAIRYWKGERSRWKGRVYQKTELSGHGLVKTENK